MDVLLHVTFIGLLLSIFELVSTAGASNCTLKSGNLKNENCMANMKINWWHVAPYVYYEKGSVDKKIKGTFKDIIERTVRKCCGECVQFTYLTPSTNSELLKKKIGTNGSVLNFPIYGEVTTSKFQSFPFFPVIESPGIIYLQKIAETGKSAGEVLNAVFTGWPVLVLTLIMAALSGIIMWALDTYWNPEEFPRSFFKGAWEGFWWAFVSMTTVGYGDKAPRSFIGRVFAFFWVLIGLVIISIFTATITTALTAVSLSNDVTLFGKRVVVLNHTEEQRFGVRENAKMVPVGSIEKLLENITTPSSEGSTPADGGLIDSYVAGFERDRLTEANGVIVAKVFEYQFTYGFVISNQFQNTKIEKCLRRQLSTDESYIVEMIQNNMKALPEPKKSAAEEKSGNMFDASSTIFQTAIFICLGIIIVLTLCGLAWEYLYWRPRLAKEDKKCEEPERAVQPHTSYEELVATQCQELDDVMIAEVMGFYKVFNKKMEEIRKLHLQQQPITSEQTHEKGGKISADPETQMSHINPGYEY